MIGISDVSKLIKTFENIDFEKLINDTERAVVAAEETVETLKDIRELLTANLIAAKGDYRKQSGTEYDRYVVVD
jgi:hypothetical protein